MNSGTLPKDEGCCIACGNEPLRFFGARNGYSYFRCAGCGTLQLVPMPDMETLAQAYRDSYADTGHCQARPETRNDQARPQFEAICAALRRHASPALVVDYGCGWGGLLQVLHANGLNVIGVELAETMATYCESLNFKVVKSDLKDIEGGEFCDAIVLSSVFEHLTDHAQWLNAARRLLKKDGLIVSLQPTSAFATLLGLALRFGIRAWELPQLHQVFWPPWHTVLFSVSGMSRLLDRCGFDLVEVRPAPYQRETGFTGILQRVLTMLNHCAIPLFGERWPLSVGHIFVFRKREMM